MVTLSMLVAPILVATVLAFLASFLLWMVLQFHRNDFQRLPNEDAVAEALRRQSAAPGQYMLPHAADAAARRNPEYMKKMAEGPVATVVVHKPGFNMGKALTVWFLYLLAVSVFVAYLASRTLPAGTAYLPVFRVTGTVALLAYSAAVVPLGIWFGWPWKNVWKQVFDGLVYALLTAGAFGWLWPE